MFIPYRLKWVIESLKSSGKCFQRSRAAFSSIIFYWATSFFADAGIAPLGPSKESRFKALLKIEPSILRPFKHLWLSSHLIIFHPILAIILRKRIIKNDKMSRHNGAFAPSVTLKIISAIPHKMVCRPPPWDASWAAWGRELLPI